jgi:hypothetical protein
MSPTTFSVPIETESTFLRFQLGLIDRVIVRTMNACRVSSTTQTSRVGLKSNAETFLRGLLKTNDGTASRRDFESLLNEFRIIRSTVYRIIARGELGSRIERETVFA